MPATLLAVLLLTPAPQLDRLGDISDSLEALARRVNPAVVQILTTRVSVGQGLVPSANLVSEQRSGGSGVVLTEDGYIVTNAHVVSQARRVRVLIPPEIDETASVLGRRGNLVGAQVVGVDLETDLAVLKVQRSGLSHLSLGDSDNLQAGELVLAFGSPLGLGNSVTMGVVSAVARQLTPEDPMIYIQTDASINPGNSGGPLVDSDGNVVGINTLIFSQSGGNEGLGFAAPSNIVRNVFDQIRATGRVLRGQVGVAAQTITEAMASGLSLPRDWGVILSDVIPNGPAAAAGLEPGDIVLSFDGKPMENGRQFRVNVYQRRVGDRVRLEVLRGEETLAVTVQITETRDRPNRFEHRVTPEENLVPELSILGMDLNAELLPLFDGLRRSSGVVVAARAIEANPFQGEGLLPGDVIYSVNAIEVLGLDGLKRALAGLGRGDALVLRVEREGILRYVTLER